MIAGVNQIEAVDRAVGLRGAGFAEQEAGVVPVGGEAGDAFVHHPTVQHRKRVFAHLCDPATVKGGHFIITGQIHQAAHESGQPHRLLRGVCQHRPSGQSGFKGGKIQLQLRTRLGHGDHKGLTVAVGLWQGGGHGYSAGNDLMAVIAEICADAGQRQGTFPIIAPTGTAPGQSHHIGAAFHVGVLQQHRAAPAETGSVEEGLRIGGANRRAKM